MCDAYIVEILTGEGKDACPLQGSGCFCRGREKNGVSNTYQGSFQCVSEVCFNAQTWSIWQNVNVCEI